ncbi:MAG: hypothetical protein ACE5D3_08300, partial [Candidatus Binatia bacterium]
MVDQTTNRLGPPVAPLWVTAFLQVLAVLLILTTVVAISFQVMLYVRQAAPIQPVQIVGVVAAFVAGLAAGALMLAIAKLLNYWHAGLRSLAALREVTESVALQVETSRSPQSEERPQPQVATPTEGPRLDPQLVQNVLSLLNDIRDNTLLGEEERRVKLERLVAEHRRKQIAQFETRLAQGQFHQAERILEELVRRFGSDDELDHLAGRVVSTRAQVEKQHVEQARAKLQDLLSINAWDRAERIAADLVELHPTSDQARQILEDVKTQKSKFQKEQRGRLLAEIEKKTNVREWQPALQTAKLLLRLYPDSPEAE